jgi:hypothetical protein
MVLPITVGTCLTAACRSTARQRGTYHQSLVVALACLNIDHHLSIAQFSTTVWDISFLVCIDKEAAMLCPSDHRRIEHCNRTTTGLKTSHLPFGWLDNDTTMDDETAEIELVRYHGLIVVDHII